MTVLFRSLGNEPISCFTRAIEEVDKTSIKRKTKRKRMVSSFSLVTHHDSSVSNT
jgi:hypothetical protein